MPCRPPLLSKSVRRRFLWIKRKKRYRFSVTIRIGMMTGGLNSLPVEKCVKPEEPDKTTTGADVSTETRYFKTKKIRFGPLEYQIVTQNTNGPCPLIAIINALVLKGKVVIAAGETASSTELLTLLTKFILTLEPPDNKTKETFEENFAGVMNLMDKLLTGLNVNVKFRNMPPIEGFALENLQKFYPGGNDFSVPSCDLVKVIRQLGHGIFSDDAKQIQARIEGSFDHSSLEELVNWLSGHRDCSIPEFCARLTQKSTMLGQRITPIVEDRPDVRSITGYDLFLKEKVGNAKANAVGQWKRLTTGRQNEYENQAINHRRLNNEKQFVAGPNVRMAPPMQLAASSSNSGIPAPRSQMMQNMGKYVNATAYSRQPTTLKRKYNDDQMATSSSAQQYRKESAGEGNTKRVYCAVKPNQPGDSIHKMDISSHFHVFVGDLSSEIDSAKLKEAFLPFGKVSEAKIIRDATTNKAKGYGFVSYPRREDAERAIEQMNGQCLGRRTIRTNWASRKPGEEGERRGGGFERDRERGERFHGGFEKTYDEVFHQTSPDNTSVYVRQIGSLTEKEIRRAFDRFGAINEVRIFKLQGYAFVKFEQKEPAARAIVQMNNTEIMGRMVRCSWGKSGDESETSRKNPENNQQ